MSSSFLQPTPMPAPPSQIPPPPDVPTARDMDGYQPYTWNPTAQKWICGICPKGRQLDTDHLVSPMHLERLAAYGYFTTAERVYEEREEQLDQWRQGPLQLMLDSPGPQPEAPLDNGPPPPPPPRPPAALRHAPPVASPKPAPPPPPPATIQALQDEVHELHRTVDLLRQQVAQAVEAAQAAVAASAAHSAQTVQAAQAVEAAKAAQAAQAVEVANAAQAAKAAPTVQAAQAVEVANAAKAANAAPVVQAAQAAKAAPAAQSAAASSSSSSSWTPLQHEQTWGGARCCCRPPRSEIAQIILMSMIIIMIRGRGRRSGGAGYRSNREQFAGLRVVDALPEPHGRPLLFRLIEADGLVFLVLVSQRGFRFERQVLHMLAWRWR